MDRKKFQGVLNILNFNRHFYIIGLGMLLLLMVSTLLVNWNPIAFYTTIIAFGYGLLMPLIISAYVYDFSGFYKLDWLQRLEPAMVKHVMNINAGFDETSYLLERKFPDAELKVLDFYNPGRHTEPAIIRARKVSRVYPGTGQTDTGSIKMNDETADIIFLISAAHEIRSNEEKLIFLKECHRICKPGGQLILVEHLRDLPNFFAFTVGFTHFFSSRVWKNVLRNAGFVSCRETKFTPFMSIFCCKR